MLRINVSRADTAILETETITAGRAGLQCGFTFSADWDGLAKTVVVNGAVKRDVVLVDDTIKVPAECLATANYTLRIGVCGVSGDGEIVIPTLWTNFGKILPSAQPSGAEPDEVTPDVVAQIQQNSSDALYLAQEVLRRADSGEFDGRDGATGPSGATGPTGPKGDAFEYSDFTAEQLAALTGPQGPDGSPGEDGVSPVVAVTEITGGHRVAITDAQGTSTFDVMDGETGPAGVGVPTGGTTGQVLAKASNSDYDTEWVDQSGGSDEVFWATYGTTTAAEVADALSAEKLVAVRYLERVYSLSRIGDFGADRLYYFTNVWGNAVSMLTLYSTSWTNEGSQTIPPASSSNPSALGTATPGTSSYYARADHVHPMPSAADVGAVGSNQGSANAGKFLVVGSDGNVTTMTLAEWQGGSY